MSKNNKSRKGYTVESLQFGFPSAFSSMTISFSSTYWTLFLTGTVGVTTVMMASIMSVSAIADAVSMPICGIVLQKAKLKSGKFRPWLLIGAIACAILRWLTFTDLGFTGFMQGLWFGGTYILCFTAFNLFHSAYTGLMPLLAHDPQDRVVFYSARMMINSVGRMLLSMFGLSLIGILGAGNDARGYNLVAALIGILLVASSIPLANLAKKVDIVDYSGKDTGKGAAPQYEASFWDMLKSMLNKNYLTFLLGTLGRMTTQIMSGSLCAYYYRYVVGDLNMLTWYLSASSFMAILGAFAGPYVTKMVKQAKYTMIIGMMIYGTCLGSAYFFGTTAVSFTALLCIGSLGLNMSASCDGAVYSNVVDYTEWKTGKNLRPFMMSMLTMTNKIGMFLSTSIFGWGLVAIGFDAQNVTENAVNGIRVMMSALPAAFLLISIIALFFLNLTDDQNRRIQQELEERHVRERAEAAAE